MLRRESLPQLNEIADVREAERVVYGEQQLAVNGHVAPVAEGVEERQEMCRVVLTSRIGLFHHQSVALQRRRAPPCLVAPCVVCPADAEREIRLAACHHLVERPLEQLLAASEPVVVVAEALDAGLACQPRLLLARLRQSQVIEPEVGRDARLPVPTEQRLCPDNVYPLREPRSPPQVVFRDGVELRQVEGNDSYFH
mgnify:CR=1 FL=1